MEEAASEEAADMEAIAIEGKASVTKKESVTGKECDVVGRVRSRLVGPIEYMYLATEVHPATHTIYNAKCNP